jgi:hypothetical protein
MILTLGKNVLIRCVWDPDSLNPDPDILLNPDPDPDKVVMTIVVDPDPHGSA